MKKILFVLPNLAGGGAERVTLNLCRGLNKCKYEIILCLLKKEGDYINEIPDGIKVIDLNISRVRYSFFSLIYVFFKVRPDIVFSTIGHFNAFIGATKFFVPKEIKFIAREANIISQKKYSLFIKWFYKFFYKNFNLIICQSQDMVDDLNKFLPMLKTKTVKINNPVNYEDIRSKNRYNEEELFPEGVINLLTVGSCTYQKGYDMLLESLARFQNINRFHLTIIGKGELLESTKKLSEKLNIKDNVSFLGFKENPYNYMSQADIFISSSRYEGFPNVVLESLVCGTPVIGNNYLGGINEIITHDIMGAIIDINDSQLFEVTSTRIFEKNYNEEEIVNIVLQKYSMGKIIQEYEYEFDNI